MKPFGVLGGIQRALCETGLAEVTLSMCPGQEQLPKREKPSPNQWAGTRQVPASLVT